MRHSYCSCRNVSRRPWKSDQTEQREHFIWLSKWELLHCLNEGVRDTARRTETPYGMNKGWINMRLGTQGRIGVHWGSLLGVKDAFESR